MVSDASLEGVFEGSDGAYYTHWEVDRRLRVGTWKPCIRQRNPDRRLVETKNRDLLLLVPVALEDLPSWTEIRIDKNRRRAVDTRRPGPPSPT